VEREGYGATVPPEFKNSAENRPGPENFGCESTASYN